MSTDVLKVSSNERVDLGDFLFAVDEALRANARQYGDQFLADPARAVRGWVVSGFGTDSPAASQVRVTLGRAILAQREVGQVFYGALVSEGDPTKIVDISTYANGSYGVYLRFELIDGAVESRAFWNPAGLGSEIAQTVATRRLANWSVRIELTNPGAEWLKVADVTVAGGAVGVITDRRDFFFEGRVDATYQSGWSTEGGGSANDRSATRATYGTHDLHTALAAVRQCLEDIKGRGLRRWWSKGIGGLNVGFDTDPVEDTIAVGDTVFGLSHPTPGVASSPTLGFDSGDILQYSRSSNSFNFGISSITVLSVSAFGTTLPSGGAYYLSDAETFFGEIGPNTPTITWDQTGGDYMQFDRTGNVFSIYVGGASRLGLTSSKFSAIASELAALDVGITSTPVAGSVRIANGLDVGFTSTPVTDNVRVGDVNFLLEYNATNPKLTFDSGDSLSYQRTNNRYTFTPGLVQLASLTADPATPLQGDIYSNSVSDQLAARTDTRFQNITPFVFESDGATPTETAGSEIAFDDFYTIPANTLRAGSIIDLYIVLGNGGNSLATSYLVRFGSQSGLTGSILVLASSVTFVNSNRFIAHARAIVQSIGASGQVQASSMMVASEIAAPATGFQQAFAPNTLTLDTTSALDVYVTAQTGSGSQSHSLIAFHVSIT